MLCSPLNFNKLMPWVHKFTMTKVRSAVSELWVHHLKQALQTLFEARDMCILSMQLNYLGMSQNRGAITGGPKPFFFS